MAIKYKYAVFHSFSGRKRIDRKKILAKLKDHIGSNPLHPLFIFEIQKDERLGEFYIGLAFDFNFSEYEYNDGTPVDSDDTRIPEWYHHYLHGIASALGIKLVSNDVPGHKKAPVFFYRNALRFMQGKIEAKSFNSDIQFEEFESATNELTSDDELKEITINIDQEAINKLYWWCSAMNEGSYDLFKKTCEKLGLGDKNKINPRHLLRRMVLLGHIICRDNDTRWEMTPTRVIKNLAEEDVFHLTGKWTPWLDGKIHNGKLPRVSTNGGPQTIEVKSNEVDNTNPKYCSIIFEPLDEYLTELLPFSEWKARLARDPDIHEHRYLFSRYLNGGFTSNEPFNKDKGLYKVVRQEGDEFESHKVFDGEEWISAPYYDLRFLHYSFLDNACVAKYLDDGTLAIDDELRWPLEYEKLLTKSTGKLARQKKTTNGKKILYYDNVDKNLVTAVCNALEVKLDG